MKFHHVLFSILISINFSFSQTWSGISAFKDEPQKIVLTKNSNNSFTIMWSYANDKENVVTKQLSVTSKKINTEYISVCETIYKSNDAIILSEGSSKNYFILEKSLGHTVYLSYVNELGECIFRRHFRLTDHNWKESDVKINTSSPINTTNSEPNKKVQRVFDAITPPEQPKTQESSQDGDLYDKTVYNNCIGEYKLGCTDVNGHIKEVQICIGVPATGKFGPITEKALINKHGIFKFTPDQIWILCGRQDTGPAVY